MRFNSLVMIGACWVCCLSGCGPGEAKTYPVSGKVVFQGGNGDVKALRGWFVYARSVADPKQQAFAEIGQDGTYKLASMVSNRDKLGLVEGQHQICFFANPFGGGGGGGGTDDGYGGEVSKPRSAVIDPKFLSFDTSGIKLTVPIEGEFTIEVSK